MSNSNTCQHNAICGGFCESDEQIKFALCEDCLDSCKQDEELRERYFALLDFIADIREAAGDETEGMMQDEFIEHIKKLNLENTMLKSAIEKHQSLIQRLKNKLFRSILERKP